MDRVRLCAAAIWLLASSTPAGLTTAAASAGPALLNSGISVVVNPTGLAPLTALADFTTTVKCSVQVRVLGEIEVTQYIVDATTAHSVPILGLYPDRVNTVILTLYTHHGTPEPHTVSIPTGPLPGFFPDIVIDAATPGLMEPGMNLCAFGIGGAGETAGYPLIFDARGDVRWYLDLSKYRGSTLPFERISDGNFVFGNGPSLYEYDILGRLVRQITIPGYNFHHDIKELPNGNFVACVDEPDTYIVNSYGLIKSQSDHMVELDRGSGAIVTQWDLREVLDVDRNEQINSSGDWFHMNSMWYSAADDCFIICGRVQGFVKVTRDNRLKWILSAHAGWGRSGYDGSGPEMAPFLLTAVDSAGAPYDQPVQDGFAAAGGFDWAWAPHAPEILPDGNFFIFDNGIGRGFSYRSPYFSRGVEYAVDEGRMTVRQVWEYGQERGQEMYSTIISNVDRLPLTGNRLIAPGIVEDGPSSYAKVVEVTYPDKAVVFEATLHFKNLSWTGEGVADNVYRSHRVSLYPFSPVSGSGGLSLVPGDNARPALKIAESRSRPRAK
jgi:arylsulfate sulfotransferase